VFLEILDDVVGFVHRHIALVIDEERNLVLAAQCLEVLVGQFVAVSPAAERGL
jgi:hypothetical protein